MTCLLAMITGEVIISTKIFLWITVFLSGISMYKLVYDISKNKYAALISSVIYMVAPYRLLNLYVRFAIGEILAVVFLPVIFRGVYHILNGDTKKDYLFVLGAIGLVLTHNISAMLCAILGVIYILINVKKLKDKKIFVTFLVGALIIVLSVIFFEIPLLEQKSSAEYEVFRYGKMYSRTSVYSHAIFLKQLIFKNGDFIIQGVDSNMYFCLGIPLLLGICLTIFVRKSIPEGIKNDYKFFMIAGIISAIMSTRYFPWLIMPDILLMIQFPWRMISIVVFCLSIVTGINYSIFIDKILEKIKENKYITKRKTKSVILVLLTVLFLGYGLSFTTNLETKEIDTSHYQEEEIIDTTMEVSRYSSFLEYWPQKAVKNINYIVNRGTEVKIIEGNTNIIEQSKINGKLQFKIDNTTNNTKLELPYLYYKGYEIILHKTNTNEYIKLEAKESEKGLLETDIRQDMNGIITVQYRMTTLHRICCVISITTFICYIIYLILRKKKIS